ncbi:MAG: hypothetical protein OXE96_16360 [Gemmatimonadetes bacterium]|nr:hypothetical protein [Gemmatimonadota bacterium]
MREKRGRPVDRFRTLSAAVAALAMAGCEAAAWAAADSAVDAAMVVAGEAHALATRVASDAEVDDGDSQAERAFDAADAARAAQAEARAWTERDSVDPALLAEAFRITDAAWRQAVTAAAEAAAVWDVALSVGDRRGYAVAVDLAALVTADSAWVWRAAWSAALLEANTWDSVPSVAEWWLPLEVEAADSLARFLQPWAAADSAAAVRVFAEWAARDSLVEAAYDAAEATMDGAAVAAYDAALERFHATEKDAADSAAERAGERARQAFFDAGEAAYDAAWEARRRTRPGTAAREAAVAATESASEARWDVVAALEAGAAAERAHGGGAYYAALRARDMVRDAAEATKDSAAVAAYEEALEALDPWSGVEPGTKVRLAAMKAREAVDAVNAAAAAWAAVPRQGATK